MKNYSVIILFVLSVVCITVDANAVEKRTFQEVNIEPQEEKIDSSVDPHEFMQNMPDDDIHAAFRKGQGAMPNTDAMPDDDIHKQFKVGSSMSGGMAMDPALMNSVAPTALSWTTPEGWIEEKGNGMRIVTFKAGQGGSEVETSVISLAGGAGGMVANVSRWMGQLNLEVPSAVELDEFINKQEKMKSQSGLEATVIDFTQLQKETPANAPSMIAAVIEGASNQIFVKMTGSKEAVLNNLKTFKALIGSLKDGSNN